MVGSAVQKFDFGSVGATMPVTRTLTLTICPVWADSGPVISNFEPAWRPNLAAVCLLIATSSVGSGGAGLPAGLAAIGLPVLGSTTIGVAPGWVTTGMPRWSWATGSASRPDSGRTPAASARGTAGVR